VPQHEQFDVFHVQAAPATNERAEQGLDGEIKKGESHAADPPSPLAPSLRHRYWRPSRVAIRSLGRRVGSGSWTWGGASPTLRVRDATANHRACWCEYERVTAAEIARLVRSGERSAVDVVREHLARIDELDPSIAAFQVVRREEALAEAESLLPANLPLAGVPVAVKDNLDVAGVPTRHGSAATAERPAERDDELVRRCGPLVAS
jgi:hypothetical protein